MVEAEPILQPAQMEALNQGATDLITNNEPWTTIFSDAGHRPVLAPVAEILPGSEAAVVLFGRRLLEESDLGNRVMVAYLKGVRQYSEGATDRNVEILAEHIGLEPDLLRRICWQAIRSDGVLNTASVDEFQAWAVEQGYQDSVVPVEQYYDPRFLEYANGVLGE
jgi:hypothetical protein